MKKISILSLLVGVQSATALAVNVKDCPANLRVQYSDLYVSKTIEAVIEEVTVGDDTKIANEVEEAFKNVTRVNNVSEMMNLSKAQKGRCTYENGKDNEKAELYTSKGRTQLLVQTNLGPRGFLLRVYAGVDGVKPTGLTLAKSRPGLALAIPRSGYDDYSYGGPLAFIGKVEKFEVSVTLPEALVKNSEASVTATDD